MECQSATGRTELSVVPIAIGPGEERREPARPEGHTKPRASPTGFNRSIVARQIAAFRLDCSHSRDSLEEPRSAERSMENPAPAPIGVNKAEGGERLRLATLNSRAGAGAARPPPLAPADRSNDQACPPSTFTPNAPRHSIRHSDPVATCASP